MRKMMLFAMIALTLTGCETLKYTTDQVFGDQRKGGLFISEETPVPQDNLVANMDQWVRTHLW